VEKICETHSGQKFRKLSTGSLLYVGTYGVLSILLVILLGLASQIKIFNEAPPNSKSELKMFSF
jgi:hypothetical protein